MSSLRDRLSAAWRSLRDGEAPAEAVISNAVDIPNGTLGWQEAVRMGIFGPLDNSFGPAVTDDTATKVSTVYACLSRLGGAISQLPLHQYRLDEAGDRQRTPQPTALWWLLNEAPHDRWTAASWKEWIVRCVYLRGDQHTEIIRRGLGGQIVGFKPHHPDLVQPCVVGDRLEYHVCDSETGRIYAVDQDDMLHFSGFGFDGVRSLSAIRHAARNNVSSALGTAQFMGRTVTEGGLPKIALKYPNKLSPEGAQLLRDKFIEIYGGQGGKLPLVLSEGGEAVPLNISPVDMELLATRKFDKAEICEAIGVPPIIIGDSEKTSSWGTGIEQVTLGWVRFVIQPVIARWEEELNRKLFRRAGQFLEFSLAALLRGDSKAQAEAFRAALGGPGTGDGWMSVNDVRKLMNLPRLNDPEADKPFRAQRATTPAASAA